MLDIISMISFFAILVALCSWMCYDVFLSDDSAKLKGE